MGARNSEHGQRCQYLLVHIVNECRLVNITDGAVPIPDVRIRTLLVASTRARNNLVISDGQAGRFYEQ